ncbi:uncharacterized protein LOC123441736 [Hordeum vulgare subsp. vulgare]|uniref:uncharacterized protein LOC123441736 n=1 Tax=Hordeum vulgare subsp. vulgare TaxID=112509 RepID=UPI001D1A3C6A|nr:uncharacterized protein LOC123441736 [Hordeum vulgare subsp. vulgare]
MYPHHCADAVNRGDFQCWNSMIFIRAWRLEAHADNKAMMHHVRLCIEGIPVHSRNTYIDTFFISPGCSLDYIEQRSLRREDTYDLALWAWTADPSCIPKVKWLTHPACGHHRRGCRGLRHRVLLHLDLHKDHSKARDDDNPPPPDIYEHTWVRKMVHGSASRREHMGDQGRDDHNHNRRNDEGGCDGGRGRDGGHARHGWRDRVRRSLSRNPRTRQRQEEGGH